MAQKAQQIDGVTSTGVIDTADESGQPENADLSALDGIAATVDEGNGHAPDGTLIADQPEPVNYQTEAAAAVDMFAGLLAGYCPDAGALWTPEKKTAVVAALVPVMQKYGVSLGALPCELVLIIVAGPLVYQTARMVAAQMAREKAQARAVSNATATDAKDKARPPAETPEILRSPQAALYPQA